MYWAQDDTFTDPISICTMGPHSPIILPLATERIKQGLTLDQR